MPMDIGDGLIDDLSARLEGNRHNKGVTEHLRKIQKSASNIDDRLEREQAERWASVCNIIWIEFPLIVLFFFQYRSNEFIPWSEDGCCSILIVYKGTFI